MAQRIQTIEETMDKANRLRALLLEYQNITHEVSGLMHSMHESFISRPALENISQCIYIVEESCMHIEQRGYICMREY